MAVFLCFICGMRAQSGSCGANLTWELSDSTLTIRGEGAMSHDSYHSCWKDYKSQIAHIVLPDGLTNISAEAFSYCENLQSVDIPCSVITIGKWAFRNCSRLRSITLPEGLITIEGAAFCGCDLVNVSLPKSLKIIEGAAYQNSGYNSWPHGVFQDNKNLKSIIIPDGVTKIGSYAFRGCSGLQTVVLGDELLTIGKNAFERCSSLKSISIPNKVSIIQTETFYYCSSLSQVTLCEGLTTIETNAFIYCSSLRNIRLPKSITSLPGAFQNSGLQEIEIPEGVTELSYTFSDCNNLSKVILPSSLVKIGAYSFKGCTNLVSIALPQSVQVIGERAFGSCSNLNKINLPQTITTIGSYAFYYCTSLREIAIPNKVTKIGNYIFQGCTSLSSVTLSNNITSIGDRAFEDCHSLTNINMPTELTFIDNTAFQNCRSLHSITIPSKVTQLGGAIFNGCSSLASITLLPATPPTINPSTYSGKTFNGVPSTAVIKVLCKNLEAYLTDSIWKATVTLPIKEIPVNILTAKSNDNRMGEAYIPTPNTCDNDTAVIEALPRDGYQFAQWSDGNADNPRTIIVDNTLTLTAIFEPLTTYQLTVKYDSKQGYVAGVGEYYPNEEATLTVTPLGGYRFSQWSDGNTDNPRTIVMTQDTTLEAIFITGDYCGDNILYTVKNDTLALNGKGDMWNLSEFGWEIYADQVTTLQLSNGITSLGTNAFMDLMFVSEVKIPATVKTIHKRAFENCRSLTSVEFVGSSQLQTIDHWAFYECINLQSISIPEGVTTIGNGAFYGCAYLDSLTLPSTLESIADNGFALCAKLKQMRVKAEEPPVVDSKTFENVSRSIPVYVPFGTGDLYRSAEVWKEFNIQEESNTETAVNNPSLSPTSQKLLRDGQLLIIRDGKTYNAQGQEVR